MTWWVHAEVSHLFPSMQACADLDGENINANWMSRVDRITDRDVAYYVKVYNSRGRWMRRFLGRSRVRAEWENLKLFHTLGIPAAEVVAFGETSAGPEYQGVVVTREVRGTLDLDALYRSESEYFSDVTWRRAVIRRLAAATRKLHLYGFVHNDLKWRNILVETVGDPQVYLIDCPVGRKTFWPLLSRGKVKDLACLDKHGKVQLSRADRLRFYLLYKGHERLEAADKKEICRVLDFFKGRE